MAAVVLGISLSFTACSDDDDDNKSEQTRDDVDPLDTDEARTAFRWLCVLADATTLDDNWKSKTYEPTIGQASENNQYTRIVVVNNLNEAKVNFSKFADIEVSQLGTKKVVDGGAAGTMTWEPSAANAQNLAEVTVSSRIMPHLQKIVYCTEAQVGSNGILWDSMKGTAYYRFGDVIRDPEGYYWVCVRPAFAPDKSDSHWINIFNAAESGGENDIPAENVITKWNNQKKYGYQTIKLPTKLAYDREHIHNLSNLIWALLKPEAYNRVCLENESMGLGGFPYKYHGEKFLKLVGQYWEEKVGGHTIWEKLFNHSGADMQRLQTMNFFYYGYSWKWGNSGYVYCYSSQEYIPNYIGKVSQDEKEYDFVTGGFDITHFAHKDQSKALPMGQFVKDGDKYNGTWVIRYKRGDKLCTTGSYSPYREIGGCTEIYRYNKKNNIDPGENVSPQEEKDVKIPEKIELANVKEGNVIDSNGNFYASAVGLKTFNIQPVAVVVCVRKFSTVEANTNYNALALALHEGASDYFCQWGEKNKECGGKAVVGFPRVISDSPLNGLAMTKQLAAGCSASHNHPAAKACETFFNDRLTAATRQEKGFSEWFLPSLSQWQLALAGLGVTGWNNANGYLYASTGTMKNEISAAFTKAGLDEYFTRMSAAEIWSATPYDNNNANVVRFGWTVIAGNEKDSRAQLYPMIAFRVE